MNAVATTITADTVTMTSLELVEMINATRFEGLAVLLHKSFLTKVPKVLGVETSEKFFAHVPVPGPNGAVRQSPIYRLPKREACLVAMSYKLMGGNPPTNIASGTNNFSEKI